jgi:hypothetical protein
VKGTRKNKIKERERKEDSQNQNTLRSGSVHEPRDEFWSTRHVWFPVLVYPKEDGVFAIAVNNLVRRYVLLALGRKGECETYRSMLIKAKLVPLTECDSRM